MVIKHENDLALSLLTVTQGRKFNIFALSSVSSSSDSSSMFTNSNSFSHVHVPLQCTPRKMAPIALSQGSAAPRGFVVVVQAYHIDKCWNSHLSLIDPNLSGDDAVVDLFSFDQNTSTAAFSVCVIDTTSVMSGKHGVMNPIIIVGSAAEMDVTTGVGSCYYLHSFTTRCHRETGKWSLLLLHSINLDEFPRTMSCFWPTDDNDDQSQCQGLGKCSYKNLLVGSDNMLYLFEVNKGANLVKKCDLNLGTKRSHLNVVKLNDANKTLSNYHKISRISVHGSRIFVGDNTNSVSFVKYNRTEKRFVLFAEDQECPRFVSALVALDRDSVGGGDRFGNVFSLQLQDGIDDDVDVQDAPVDDDGFGTADVEVSDVEEKIEQKHDGKKRTSSKENDTVQRNKHPRTENNEGLLKCHFYVGESITTVCTTRSQLFSGYRINSVSNSNIDSSIKAGSRGYFNNSGSVLIAGTIGGGLSAFVPLRDDFVFFYMNLESCIRNCTGASSTKRYDGDTFGGDELKEDFSASGATSGGLCIRHHQSYRSYFQPAKGTIDGDLLLTYKLMSRAQQADIAESLSKLILSSEDDTTSNSSKLLPQHIIERIDAAMMNIL